MMLDLINICLIYNNRSNQDSEGMFGRDVMRILSNLGSCSEDTYPYRTIESLKIYLKI